MEQICENCGEPFKARRASRRYCSNSCRQLAYFKRHGVTKETATPSAAPIEVTPDKLLEQLKAFIQTEVDRKCKPNEQSVLDVNDDNGGDTSVEGGSNINVKNQRPIKTVSDKKSYRWHYSHFTALVQKHVSYTDEEVEQVRRSTEGTEVLTCFKSVVREILSVSNRTRLNPNTLIKLSNTMYQLVHSWKFLGLPMRFPFRKDIQAWQKKLRAGAQGVIERNACILKIGHQGRAKLWAILLVLHEGFAGIVKDVPLDQIQIPEEDSGLSEMPS